MPLFRLALRVKDAEAFPILLFSIYLQLFEHTLLFRVLPDAELLLQPFIAKQLVALPGPLYFPIKLREDADSQQLAPMGIDVPRMMSHVMRRYVQVRNVIIWCMQETHITY